MRLHHLVGPCLIAATVLAGCQARAQGWADDLVQNAKLVPPVPLHEQVLHLTGDQDRPVSLEVTLYTPDGAGPFPLAVMNHGANGSKERPAEMARYHYTYTAYYFLSRGYAVALPMMRGYGGSGGSTGNHGCDFAAMAHDNGRDIAGVIEALSSDSRIDTTRVVVAGQSFGGWNTLGLGAVAPPSVRGLIDFFGGVHSTGCRDATDEAGAALIEAAGLLGAETSLPSLWFYGQNDSLFPPATWQPMHRAYVRAGGHAELVDVGRFMEDSHQMLSHPESIPIWVPRVDAFLARIGLPSAATFPRYMPTTPPVRTDFAKLDDVAAVPWVSAAGRTNYSHFLTLPLPRVFMVAPGGQSASAQGGFDVVARGYALCRNANLACEPYAVDTDVVWVPHGPPTSAAPASSAGKLKASRFAAIGDVEAVPWVNDRGRETYRRFLAAPLPRAFVVGMGGESASTQGGGDPLGRAMQACAAAQIVCRPYAIDERVVWVAPAPPPAPPPASGFAPLGDVSAVPWTNARGKAGYAHFLTMPPPRAFVVAPGGQTAQTQGGYDPLGRALALCRKNGLACRPYAVDDRVVWLPPRGP